MQDDNDKLLGDFNIDESPEQPPEGEPVNDKKVRMLPFNIIFGLLAIIVIGAVAYFFLQSAPTPSVEPIPVVVTPTPTLRPTPVPTPTKAPRATPTPTPIPTPTPDPLPALNDSDPVLTEELTGLQESLPKYTTKEEVARKFVRATYSAYQGNVVQQYRPVTGPNTAYTADKTGQQTTVTTKSGEKVETPVYTPSKEAFKRYNLYASIASAVSPEALLNIYSKYYPLLQQAYGELGEGPNQFHTVVLGALDKLIDTPNLEDSELKLVRKSVVYTFADPKLEALPASQKLLLRMGKENRSQIQNKMQKIHTLFAAFTPE